VKVRTQRHIIIDQDYTLGDDCYPGMSPKQIVEFEKNMSEEDLIECLEGDLHNKFWTETEVTFSE
jgi:hypothetical protein